MLRLEERRRRLFAVSEKRKRIYGCIFVEKKRKR